MSISPVQSGERSLAKRVGRKWVEGKQPPECLSEDAVIHVQDHNAVVQTIFYKDTSLEERILFKTFAPEHLCVSAAGLSSPLPSLDGTVRRCSSDSAGLAVVSSRRISRSLHAEGASPTGAFVCGVWHLNGLNEWRLLAAVNGEKKPED